MRRGVPRQQRAQESGAFNLEHPYRGRMPEIHELVLAWLLDDDREEFDDRTPLSWIPAHPA